MIRADDIYLMLRKVFPNMVDWLPTDKVYLTVEPDQVMELINKYRDPLNRYIPNLWECEEISSAFLVDVRRGRLDNLEQIPPDQRKNYAIGEALGTRWGGIDKPHQANVFISSAAVYLFDMQTRKVWEAKLGKDDIYFVRM